MSIVRRFRQEWLTLILLCLAAFFVNNSLLPVGGGEAKVLVTARDIVDGGNWLAPTMNGEPRYDKPPLASWVAALVQSIHADNISAQRTVAGLLGIVWTMFFFGITRYFSRRRGFAEIATVVFITTYNIIYMGRMVERDIYGYAFMMVAIYFMMRMFFDSQYFANPHKWRWAWLAGLAMGLSLLGNGLVGPSCLTACGCGTYKYIILKQHQNLGDSFLPGGRRRPPDLGITIGGSLPKWASGRSSCSLPCSSPSGRNVSVHGGYIASPWHGWPTALLSLPPHPTKRWSTWWHSPHHAPLP